MFSIVLFAAVIAFAYGTGEGCGTYDDPIQCGGLISFWTAVGGVNSNLAWPVFNGISYCAWEGVYCPEEEADVEMLEAPNLALAGPLPDDIAKLQHLVNISR